MMPKADTANATSCSMSSGLITMPKPDKMPISPHQAEGWFNLRFSMNLSVFFLFLLKN